MISAIQPVLEYSGFDRVDVVVEAVVENPKVKKAVLAETEDKVRPETVLASNTSTIPISELASVLKRQENFCGMHFFNPIAPHAAGRSDRGKNLRRNHRQSGGVGEQDGQNADRG